jgi:hypothetical protein
MLIISQRLCVFFAWFSGYSKTARAVTVFPFIFVRSSRDMFPWLITHERIHIKQQLELLVVGSVILYVSEFLYARFILRLSHTNAYYWTSAEQEAHLNQNNPNYLQSRKLFSQLLYISNKKKFSHKDGVVSYL